MVKYYIMSFDQNMTFSEYPKGNKVIGATVPP